MRSITNQRSVSQAEHRLQIRRNAISPNPNWILIVQCANTVVDKGLPSRLGGPPQVPLWLLICCVLKLTPRVSEDRGGLMSSTDSRRCCSQSARGVRYVTQAIAIPTIVRRENQENGSDESAIIRYEFARQLLKAWQDQNGIV